jgi:CRISPR-associated protein Cas2
MFVVIAYDIASDRRRMRTHALLLRYGNPVQESLFECDLSPADLRALRRELARVIRPAADKVRVYCLCRDCAAGVEDESGRRQELAPPVVIV